MKNDIDWEKLEDIALKEELHSMSVEEIMKDGHFSRDLAQVIYDVEHGLNLCEPMTYEEFVREFLK